MKPHRVIKARQLQCIGKKVVTMRQKGRVEKRHIGCVGEHALVHCRRRRQGATGAKPDYLARWVLAFGEAIWRLDRPDLNRPLAQESAARVLWMIGWTSHPPIHLV